MEENAKQRQVPLYYVNSANISLGLNDLVMEMGIKKERTYGSAFTPEEVDLVVIMSPQHAKGLVQALNQAVQIYEELYGTINLQANPEVEAKYHQQASSNV